MNHDIRAAVGPILDTALDAVSHPGDRFYWDIATTLAADQSGRVFVQTIVAISTPSPVMGETVHSLQQVDLLDLTRGTKALDLVRLLVENVRSMKAKVTGMDVGHGPIRLDQ